ncbi:amino acid ABC transporter permease [Inconstantimicrobium mannanitabidum]|uniref:Amino acid ABC transporter permease n=1 Tax=Inconstantimicrobium mannanitabidum TaxID=1604901 RepID=A0ACB5RE49_9CLOT|nr:amino acid ABC transporter permease [Clostridium sp. TW13]GKX67385.1 amino acid ABC transporter permease [Clostridium sp. TW13]
MDYVLRLMPQLLKASVVTLEVFVIVLILSIPLGIAVAAGRKSKVKIISKILEVYILIMRGTPLLLQIIIIFFGLPIVGVTFDRFTAGIIAFTLNYTAYFGEIFRAGINSIDEGQYEAAEVLGLTPSNTFYRIILPQGIKRVIPPMANEITTLVKDTSLVYVLGMDELLKMAKMASNRDITLVPLLLAGVIYLVIIGILSKVLQQVEKKYEYYN